MWFDMRPKEDCPLPRMMNAPGSWDSALGVTLGSLERGAWTYIGYPSISGERDGGSLQSLPRFVWSMWQHGGWRAVKALNPEVRGNCHPPVKEPLEPPWCSGCHGHHPPFAGTWA